MSWNIQNIASAAAVPPKLASRVHRKYVFSLGQRLLSPCLFDPDPDMLSWGACYSNSVDEWGVDPHPHPRLDPRNHPHPRPHSAGPTRTRIAKA